MQGFDLTCGILHADKPGRSSLTYDLIEPFRGIVDDKVLTLFRNFTLTKGDILSCPDGSIQLVRHLARYVIEHTAIPQVRIDKAAYALKMAMLEESDKA